MTHSKDLQDSKNTAELIQELFQEDKVKARLNSLDLNQSIDEKKFPAFILRLIFHPDKVQRLAKLLRAEPFDAIETATVFQTIWNEFYPKRSQLEELIYKITLSKRLTDDEIAQLTASSEQATLKIIEALQSSNKFPYSGAINALKQIGDERAIPTLLEFITPPDTWKNRDDYEVVSEALNALVAISKRSPNTTTHNTQIINTLEDLYLGQLLSAESSFDQNLYEAARISVDTLDQMNDKYSEELLIKILQIDYHPWITAQAAASLVQRNSIKGVTQTIELIRNVNYSSADLLIEIVKLKDQPIIHLAAKQLLDVLPQMKHEEIRAAVVWAIGQLKDPIAVPALIDYATHTQYEHRALALQGLGLCGDTRAVTILTQFTLDTSEPLYRQDHGGTMFVFRRLRHQKISDIARESLKQIQERQGTITSNSDPSQ